MIGDGVASIVSEMDCDDLCWILRQWYVYWLIFFSILTLLRMQFCFLLFCPVFYNYANDTQTRIPNNGPGGYGYDVSVLYDL